MYVHTPTTGIGISKISTHSRVQYTSSAQHGFLEIIFSFIAPLDFGPSDKVCRDARTSDEDVADVAELLVACKRFAEHLWR